MTISELRYLFKKGWIIIAATLAIALTWTVQGALADTASTPSLGEHLVTIYDSGQEKSLVTKAPTVGEALEEAGVELSDKDQVEPAVDTPLLSKNYHINIYRSRLILIVDGSKRLSVVTAAQSPESIMKAAGLDLYDEDRAELKPIDNILSGGAGLELTIDRATVFKFNLYGKTFVDRTQAETVGQLLADKGVTLGPKDGVTPSSSTPIETNMLVHVWRNGKQTVTQEQTIKAPVKKIYDYDRPLGYKQVKVAGQDGIKQVTYEIVMKGGRQVSKKVIATVVTKKPVTEQVVVGVKSGNPSENAAIIWAYLTSHGFSPEQTAGIMGNLQQEHGFKTSGDGLAQWTGGRKANLMSRDDPYSLYTQLDFMLDELDGSYAEGAIKSTNSIEQATVIFQDHYERCGLCAESKRISYAYSIYNRFN
ncbi:MAG TPA: phage tail tip lysozyme [Candidatus Saccharimonadales bacterium]|nr:phage tail tip lysozyme [Candidatus Saccharimonadales bacterium]